MSTRQTKTNKFYTIKVITFILIMLTLISCKEEETEESGLMSASGKCISEVGNLFRKYESCNMITPKKYGPLCYIFNNNKGVNSNTLETNNESTIKPKY